MVITAGEPAGIGADECVLFAQQHQDFPLCVLADPDLLFARAKQRNLPLQLLEWSDKYDPKTPAGTLYIDPIKLRAPVKNGQLDVANSPYVIEMLKRAVDGCLEGRYSAMITTAVQKSVIAQLGIEFTGHTEFLAERCNVPDVVMMLASGDLRVALVTTHLPLREVADAITQETLEEHIRILHRALQTDFGITNPEIRISGLNPHAGEQGLLGREEIDVIQPVIQRLQKENMNLIGPIPADSLFTPIGRGKADALLCMYHDQGLTALKQVGWGNAINITLGLPIIRTSVDHGTALDRAGHGEIHLGSLEAAISQAQRMVMHRASRAHV
ncbi:MAG: 4-hydroxythreonine-4-phosphate dehydrogenase PdxA [Pseudomonadota bacterium]